MKKIIITSSIFFFFIAVGLYLRGDHETKVIIHLDPHHKQKVIEIKASQNSKIHPKDHTDRSPAQARSLKRPRPAFSKAVDPKEIELHYELRADVYLTKNIAAIPKKSYQASMGRVIHQDTNFHYIESSENHSGKLSIYDAKKQTLKPLSHIIRIPNTNEARRNEITSRGFKENLYLEKLELLFIETNTTDFSVVYEELKLEGFAPEYQILNRQYFAK